MLIEGTSQYLYLRLLEVEWGSKIQAHCFIYQVTAHVFIILTLAVFFFFFLMAIALCFRSYLGAGTEKEDS